MPEEELRIAHNARQKKMLKMALPSIGEWVKRRFGSKLHKPTKLGGPEQLDDFIEKGFIGTDGDYSKNGVWRIVKKIETCSYEKGEVRMGCIMCELRMVVVD